MKTKIFSLLFLLIILEVPIQYVDALDTKVTVFGTYHYEKITEMNEFVNEERIKMEKEKIVLDDTLTEIAMERAKEISVYFNHIRPNGQSLDNLFLSFNTTYSVVEENIGVGSITDVMNDWMMSITSKDNILNNDFKKMGIGCYENNGYYGNLIILWV